MTTTDTPRTEALLESLMREVRSLGAQPAYNLVVDRLGNHAADLEAELAAAQLSLSEAEIRAKQNEDRANAVSVLHGKAFNLACDLFEALRVGQPTPALLAVFERRVYGEPRQVPPHATGQAINTLEAPK